MYYFITNREIINEGEIGTEFIRPDGYETARDNLRYGEYHVDSEIFELYEEPKKASDLIYSEIDFSNLADLKGSSKFFTTLYSHLCVGGRQDVLFFVHGFNTDLADVKKNFHYLKRSYVDNPNSPIEHIVIFTWPARSPKIPLHYHDDAWDAERSGVALARALDRLRVFFKYFLGEAGFPPCQQRIHLMLHSMGHRVFLHAIEENLKGHISGLQPFYEIICMAGDVPYNVFEKGFAFHALLDYGERVHVYFHENDRALDISKYTKNFRNMLGRYGRKSGKHDQPYIIDADVTNIKDDDEWSLIIDQINHWYYYSSTAVINDVVSIFNDKRYISQFAIKKST